MNDELKLGLTRTDKAVLIILPPILGGVIGWFLPIIAGWLVKLPFIPYGQVFEWIATLDNPWVSTVTLCIGIIAGFVFTFYAFSEALQVVVNDAKLITKLNDKTKEFPKDEISAIYMEKKQLIFLGDNGQELFRGEKPEDNLETIQHAFSQFGYPWKDQDPYEKYYFLWVKDHPDLDSHLNVLLSAREIALEEGKDKKIKDLQKELASLGIVIRDEDGKQYVREVKSEEKK